MAEIAQEEIQVKHKLLEEECVSFAQAARRLPKVRGKKHPAPSTIYRWRRYGRRSVTGERVYLESIRVGGTNCTSIEALERFFAKLNGERTSDKLRETQQATEETEQRSAEERAKQAKEILRRRGLLK